MESYTITITNDAGSVSHQFTTQEVGNFNVFHLQTISKYMVTVTAKNNENLSSSAEQEIVTVSSSKCFICLIHAA